MTVGDMLYLLHYVCVREREREMYLLKCLSDVTALNDVVVHV